CPRGIRRFDVCPPGRDHGHQWPAGRAGVRPVSAGPSLLLEVGTATLWPGELALCHHLLRLIFLGFVIVEPLRQLFLPGPVTFDTISASLCVYLLLGISWGHVFVMMETVVSNSFVNAVHPVGGLAAATGEPALTLRMYYFSFVTLSGVGYGD